MANLGKISGLAGLIEESKGGDERVCIAVLDGPVDLQHPCFEGANLSVVPVPGHAAASPSSGVMGAHGTHVASILFSQKKDLVMGIAPKCRGLIVPVFSPDRLRISQLDLTRGIERAIEAGAHIINISGGQLSDDGEADHLLQRAVRLCRDRDILIVAAAGNNHCACLHVPASIPSVLAVGAMDDRGRPLDFSNWGEAYGRRGLLAPGQEVLGAVPGGRTAALSGTSFATPIVAGVAGLLLARQIQQGQPPSLRQVRAALLKSAKPCQLRPGQQPGQCLQGRLDVLGASQLLKKGIEMSQSSDLESVGPSCGCQTAAAPAEPAQIEARGAAVSDSPPPAAVPAAPRASAPRPAVVQSSDVGMVYALGTLGYDFGTEARRDTFKQLMPPARFADTLVPGNPYDARQMVDYLGQNPSEAKALTWTLNLELTPIYALEPQGPFAHDIYEVLQDLLGGEIKNESSDDYVERVSIPGVLTGRTARLFSGQVVPVVEVNNVRGLYGWKVNTLITKALQGVRKEGVDEKQLRRSLQGYLNRVYYDLRNLGTTSRDRAINFAATNAFQATTTFAEAIGDGMELASVDVEKSPVCRIDSDCWDVKLKFFDPENNLRAKRVFRFTIDVSDTIPVTLGEVRTWTSPF